MSRWGKPYKDQRNWPEYNEQLVVRGEFYPDLGFSKNWNSDLRRAFLQRVFRGSGHTTRSGNTVREEREWR